MTTTPNAFVTDPQRATRVVAFGDDLRIHVFGSQTDGQFSIIDQSYNLPTWGWEHRHRTEDHYVQIMQGEMEFDLDGATYRCGKDQAIFIPRKHLAPIQNHEFGGCDHAVVQFSGRLEEMFFAVAAAEGGISDEQQLLSIVARHGVDVRKPE